VLLFDAAGLCLFSVTVTEKALAWGLDPVMAAVLGMITGIGGGVARDLLTLQIPTVLRTERFTGAGGGQQSCLKRLTNFRAAAPIIRRRRPCRSCG